MHSVQQECLRMHYSCVNVPYFAASMVRPIFFDAHRMGTCAGQVVAGQVGLVTIKKFGQKGHTAWSNLMNFIANTVWSFDTGQRGTILSQMIMSMVSLLRLYPPEASL